MLTHIKHKCRVVLIYIRKKMYTGKESRMGWVAHELIIDNGHVFGVTKIILIGNGKIKKFCQP